MTNDDTTGSHRVPMGVRDSATGEWLRGRASEALECEAAAARAFGARTGVIFARELNGVWWPMPTGSGRAVRLA